jgi:hypothetical protein
MRTVDISIWSDYCTDIGETNTMYLRGYGSICIVWFRSLDVDFYTGTDEVYHYYEDHYYEDY